MQDQITCPHCNKPIPLTQALSHQMQEQLKSTLEEDRKKLLAAYHKKLDEERLKMSKETEDKLRFKINKEMELRFADFKNESEELKENNKKLHEQMMEILKQNRQLKSDSEQRQLDMEKRLFEEQEKIKQNEQKRVEEQYRLKILEQEKKFQDVVKANDELKRKLEQGSQQMQGEILELEIENILKREFPYDEIQPVAKGVRGADVLQIVKDTYGKECGTIIWEMKRTKAWSDGWITKLKDDQRQVKAHVAVIITNVLPSDIKYFGNKDGIWVGNFDSIAGLALALRSNLIDVTGVRMASVGKNEKMEILYNYLAGMEFRQRVEGIIDAFTSMQDELEKEKRWFTLKWAKEEKNIRRVIDNTLGMHGDLQSIMGKALVEVKALEMLEPENSPAVDSVEDGETLF